MKPRKEYGHAYQMRLRAIEEYVAGSETIKDQDRFAILRLCDTTKRMIIKRSKPDDVPGDGR
jgi:hypothetical protein